MGSGLQEWSSHFSPPAGLSQAKISSLCKQKTRRIRNAKSSILAIAWRDAPALIRRDEMRPSAKEDQEQYDVA